MPGTASASLPVAFAAAGAELRVVGLGDPPPRAWWLTTSLQTTRGRGWRLVTEARPDGRSGPPRGVVPALRRARAAVESVLGRTPEVVVELPRDESSYAALLAARGDEYARLAAVTTTTDGSARPGAAVRIVVNPASLPQMDPGGLAVVLAHEMAHAAVGDAVGTGPLWLREGFADYVALRGLGSAGRTEALATQVRRRGLPPAPPGREDFHRSGEDLEAAYESAWVACDVLARRLGPQGLVELRTGLDGAPGGFSAALDRAGWSRPAFMERWRARLARLRP